MGIVRFALKSSVAGGAVYWTVQEGVWSSPEETMNAYCRLYNTVAPLIKKNISPDVAKDLSELPSVSTLTNCAKGMWNRGVITSFKYLSELPTHVSNGLDYVIQMATSATSNETVPAVKGMFKTPPESNKAQ